MLQGNYHLEVTIRWEEEFSMFLLLKMKINLEYTSYKCYTAQKKGRKHG